jgi:DNA-binding MarR family transcriptional regulator
MKKSASITDVVDAALGLHRIMRVRMAKIHDIGLSMPQLHALLCIQEHPSMTMKEFANALGVSSPSATALADRLVRDRLVRRFHDPRNRKLVRIRVAPRADRLMQRVLRHRNRVLDDVFSAIPAGDRKAFVRILRTIIAAHSSQSLHSSHSSRFS